MEDNNGCIGQIMASKNMRKARHYARELALLQELVQQGVMHMSRVDSDKNVADNLTKPAQGSAGAAHNRALLGC